MLDFKFKNTMYMKRINKFLLSIIVVAIPSFYSSCESYLDIAEDEQLTFESIWTKKQNIQKYLAGIWEFLLNIQDPYDTNPFYATSDDSAFGLTGKPFSQINDGRWGPTSIPCNNWKRYYTGIREATVFMQNVKNVDVEAIENVDATDIEQWYAEARFLRAYLYYTLVMVYGPVPLLGDDVVDFTKSQEEIYTQRNNFDECVNYVAAEMEECAKVLPKTISNPQDYGRPTKGACLATISSIRLYAARKLFNGNTLYRNMQNPDGSLLFPNVETVNITKWEAAAKAAKDVINLNAYSLYKVLKSDGTIDPYKSYMGVFQEKWNIEQIFARLSIEDYFRQLITAYTNPRVTAGGGAWGAWGPTQQQVDSYALANGIYPITGYNADGSPIIAPEAATAGYEDNGFANFTHPIEGVQRSTYKMYIGREPRFYASVLWSDARVPCLKLNKVTNFAFNGNCGPGPSMNAPSTGYLIRKWTNPAVNTTEKWATITYSYFRYAEILLNYIEALNECDPANPDILTYFNEIRERAGVPDIETVYPNVVGNQELMREYIRRERKIELAYEGKRYFDTRSWMISHQVDKGAIYGMNALPSAPAVVPDITPPEFWKRTVVETRVFRDAYYLYPFSSTELNKNKKLVQNYGW
jgi:hypothetical protein